MEKVTLREKVKIKDLEFEIDLDYYYEDDEYFEDIELGNENLKKIRNKYRELSGLLQDYQIKEIRDKYNLSQMDFAILLGMGEVTITRYESKQIQDKSQDALIRSADDIDRFIELVKSNKNKYVSKYNENKFESLLSNLERISINRKFSDYYKNYDQIYVGHTTFGYEKFKAIINELIKDNNNLVKTKLVKLLWYCDFYNFKINSVSMSGLPYQHMPYGAYPCFFDNLIHNDDFNIEIKELNESEIYIFKNVKTDYVLSNNERDVIKKISVKFEKMNSKEIVDYMHAEDAYIKTNYKELISYDYSKKLSI